MAKESMKTSTIAIGTVIIFIVLFLLLQKESVFDVIVKDQTDNIVVEDQSSIPLSVKITQSLFGFDEAYSHNILLQASQPLGKDNVAVLRVALENPYPQQIRLAHVEISKNNIFVGSKKFNELYLEPGKIFVYKSDEIDMKGDDGRKNNIRIRFTIIFNDGSFKHIVYQYDYLSLTSCSTNSDCSAPISACDIGNNARFSTQPNKYFCTKPCLSNSNCYEGQICRIGFCGY